MLIDQGDLPSLVALATHPSPRRIVLMHCETDHPGAVHRLAMMRAHAETFDVTRVIVESVPRMDDTVEDHLPAVRLLAIAATAAEASGCHSLIWPHLTGPDAGGVQRAVLRATMMADLVARDLYGSQRALEIDLPLMDLSDGQVVDLAEDVGVPMRQFWPCDGSEASPCGVCPGCNRWQRAFVASGVVWPWSVVGV